MAKKKNVVEETGQMDPVAFIKAVKGIVAEKEISEDIVFEAMELALATAYKKNFDSLTNSKIFIDRNTGDIKVYSYITVVPDEKEDDEVDDKEEEQKTATTTNDKTADTTTATTTNTATVDPNCIFAFSILLINNLLFYYGSRFSFLLR